MSVYISVIPSSVLSSPDLIPGKYLRYLYMLRFFVSLSTPVKHLKNTNNIWRK